MEELIINCETGERTRRKFTAAEVSQRQAEIAKAEKDRVECDTSSIVDNLVLASAEREGC